MITYANNSSFHLLMSDVFGGSSSSSEEIHESSILVKKKIPEYNKHQLFERMKRTKLI